MIIIGDFSTIGPQNSRAMCKVPESHKRLTGIMADILTNDLPSKFEVN